MRTPRNETLDSPASPPASGKGPRGGPSFSPGSDGGEGAPTPVPSREREGSAQPIRRCILSGDRDARDHLVRLALSPDGAVLPDVRAKAPGRGAWIGVTRIALDTAIAKGKLKGALARAFKTGPIDIPADISDLIATALQRNAMDRLGLEARTGTLLTGSDKIEAAARSGKLNALYHAADAGTDGNRKLDQAWRIGNGVEGSDLRGLALPIPRTILGLALGRENVVHIGVTDRAAASRVSDALNRWLHFIGPDPDPAPCETASQGASASALDGPGPAAREVHEESE